MKGEKMKKILLFLTIFTVGIFGKHAYSLLGEGKISRFVDECPPYKHYKFEKI